MKKLLILLFVLLGLQVNAQNLNQYKYIVIPESYNFLGEIDQYRLNSLTKFLFEKNGFDTYMTTEEKPADLQNNPCMGLTPNITEDSGLFTTKIILELKDCYGNVVYATSEGKSKDKDYKKAYHESLRDAFTDIVNLNYTYEAKERTDKLESEDSPMKPVILDAEEEEIENAEPIVFKIDNKRSNSSKSLDKPIYVKDGSEFILKKSDQGYSLYPEGSSEPIALLISSDNSSSFIYNSLSHQGVASFDTNKNLIVEYFDRTKNEKMKLIYNLQN